MDNEHLTEHERVLIVAKAITAESLELVGSARAAIERAKAILDQRQELLHPATDPSVP